MLEHMMTENLVDLGLSSLRARKHPFFNPFLLKSSNTQTPNDVLPSTLTEINLVTKTLIVPLGLTLPMSNPQGSILTNVTTPYLPRIATRDNELSFKFYSLQDRFVWPLGQASRSKVPQGRNLSGALEADSHVPKPRNKYFKLKSTTCATLLIVKNPNNQIETYRLFCRPHINALNIVKRNS